MKKVVAYLGSHRWLIVAFVVLIVAVVLFVIFNRGRQRSLAEQYETVAIGRGNLTATVGATGTVRASQTAVLTWQTSGTVDSVNYRVGDKVQTGAVLASLSRSSLPQSIILAEAELASAQKALEDLKASKTAQAQAAIALRQAEDAYEKALDYRLSLNERVEYEIVKINRKMTPLGWVKIPTIKTIKYFPDEDEKRVADERLALAEAQLEDARRNYERLKGGVDPRDIAAAEARVAAAQATINMSRLTAPFSGTLTEAKPLVGDQVSPGMMAFRLDDLSRLLVDVQISEVDINSVKVGQPVLLTFDAILGREYHGKVIEVAQAGTVVQGVVNFGVTVELNDADEQVRPGMTAAVNIVVNELQDVLLVPNRSVRLVNGDRVVYVLAGEQIEMVRIRLGASSDTYSVVVEGDLKDGDMIILNPPAEFQSSGGPPPFVRRRGQ